VFAVNKLDAVADPALAYAHIRQALAQFAQDAGIAITATVRTLSHNELPWSIKLFVASAKRCTLSM
jgi:hypothetical protein